MVFKRRRKREGKVVRSRYWYGQVKDAQGRRLRVKLAPDKREAERLMAQHITQAERERLGLVDRYADPKKRPLPEHLDEYGAFLAAKGNTGKHVEETVAKCRAALEGCGFERIGDLSASKTQEWLASLRERGLSASTANHYLRALKSFGRWLVRDGRTSEDPLAYLGAVNCEADRRHERRALTDDEARRLVSAAQTGPVVSGVSWPLRALAYRLALGTGLRRSEIKSLTWDNFDLDGPELSVTVEAAYSKHRRRDALPLAPGLAAALREWRRGHTGDDRVFPLPEKTAKMLRVDLAAADVPYRDAAGRVADFHCFRVTFVTNLVRGGVHVRVAQKLARHSTVTLTMDTYTRPEVLDDRRALDVLPGLVGESEPKSAEVG